MDRPEVNTHLRWIVSLISYIFCASQHQGSLSFPFRDFVASRNVFGSVIEDVELAIEEEALRLKEQGDAWPAHHPKVSPLHSDRFESPKPLVFMLDVCFIMIRYL